MKCRCVLSLLAGVLPLFAFGGLPDVRPAVEIVESIPIETTLDNPDIRNTSEVWLEMIGAARKTLDIEQFYISSAPGESLEGIIDAIAQAASRGVTVRIIVDSRMYRTYPQTADSLGGCPGITMRVIDYGKIAGGIQHAKFFLVDGRTVFLGSQNFDWRALTQIHELGLRIDNPAVAEAFSGVFDTDWALAAAGRSGGTAPGGAVRGMRVAVSAGDTAWLRPSWSPVGFIPDSSAWDETQIIGLIDGATRSLVLQFLSYATTGRDASLYTPIDDAIRRAAARGVAVRMIVADWEKGTPAERCLRDLSAVENVGVRFSVIPDWSGGYIPYARVEHCKYIVADGERFWLGTSNCEKSYFHTSRNIGVVCTHSGLAQQLARIFDKSWTGPYVEPISPGGTSTPRRHGGE